MARRSSAAVEVWSAPVCRGQASHFSLFISRCRSFNSIHTFVFKQTCGDFAPGLIPGHFRHRWFSRPLHHRAIIIDAVRGGIPRNPAILDTQHTPQCEIFVGAPAAARAAISDLMSPVRAAMPPPVLPTIGVTPARIPAGETLSDAASVEKTFASNAKAALSLNICSTTASAWLCCANSLVNVARTASLLGFSSGPALRGAQLELACPRQPMQSHRLQ